MSEEQIDSISGELFVAASFLIGAIVAAGGAAYAIFLFSPRPLFGLVLLFGATALGAVAGGIVPKLILHRRHSSMLPLSEAPSRFQELLPRFIRDDNRNDYRIRFRVGSLGWEDTIYWDCRFGFVLICNGSVVACIGITPSIKGRMITIKQIQGVKGEAKALEGIRWERLLVMLVIELARESGLYEKVFLVPGKENTYYYKTEIKESLRRRYDGTARKLKFHRNERLGVWEFPLFVATA